MSKRNSYGFHDDEMEMDINLDPFKLPASPLPDTAPPAASPSESEVTGTPSGDGLSADDAEHIRLFCELQDANERIALLEREVVDARRMVAVWKATIEMDSRDIERAAVELDVYEFRTLALSIVRRWLGKSKETIR